MNVTHQPYDDTIAAAEAVVTALGQTPINEFVLIDRTTNAVTELADKNPSAHLHFSDPPSFNCDVTTRDLVLRLARWLQALPSRGSKGAKGYLFGAVLPHDDGGYFVSMAVVDVA